MKNAPSPDPISDAVSAAERAVSRTLRELGSTIREVAGQQNEKAAAELNRHFTRMRCFENDREWCDALLDSACQFCRRAAFFSIRKGQLWYQGSRGMSAAAAPEPVELANASAFANAVSKRAVTRASRTAGDLSNAIAAFTGESEESRADLVPVSLTDRVPGVLYTEGAGNVAALEMIASFAALSLECHLLLEEGAAGRRARVRTAASSTPRDAAAQRFARVAVARIVLDEFDALRRGRLERSIYSKCALSIDAAREAYSREHPGVPDYMHEEIVRTLANNQPELLGANYPLARS